VILIALMLAGFVIYLALAMFVGTCIREANRPPKLTKVQERMVTEAMARLDRYEW
jgi:hypothetical protein